MLNRVVSKYIARKQGTFLFHIGIPSIFVLALGSAIGIWLLTIEWHLLIVLAAALLIVLSFRYAILPVHAYIFAVLAFDTLNFVHDLEVLDLGGGKGVFFTDVVFFWGAVAILLKGTLFNRHYKTSLDKGMAFFLIICAFSFVRGLPFGKAVFSEARPYFYCVVFFLITRSITNFKQVRKIGRTFLLSSLVIPIWALYSYFFGGSVGHGGLGPRYLSGSHATFLLVVIVFLVQYYIDGLKHKKWIFAIVIWLGLAILLGQSRSTYLATLFAVLGLTLINRRTRFKTVGILLLLSVILMGTIISFSRWTGNALLANIEKSFRSGFIDYDYDLSARSRLLAYSLQLKEIRKSPVLGTPFGTRFPAYYIDGVRKMHPLHSLFLAIISRIGLLGLIVYLGIVGSFVRLALKFIRSSRDPEKILYMKWFLISIGIITVLNIFNADFYNTSPWIFVWIFMGLGMVLMRTEMFEYRNDNNHLAKMGLISQGRKKDYVNYRSK